MWGNSYGVLVRWNKDYFDNQNKSSCLLMIQLKQSVSQLVWLKILFYFPVVCSHIMLLQKLLLMNICTKLTIYEKEKLTFCGSHKFLLGYRRWFYVFPLCLQGHCCLVPWLHSNKSGGKYIISLTTVIYFHSICYFFISFKKQDFKATTKATCYFSPTLTQTSKSLTYVLSVCKSSAITNLWKK